MLYESKIKVVHPTGSCEMSTPHSPNTLNLADLQNQAVVSGAWLHQLSSSSERLQFVKLKEQTSSSYPLTVTHSIVVDRDLTWKVYVHGHQVNLPHIPIHLEVGTLQQLLSTIDQLINVCAGHPDTRFIDMVEAKKGSLKSSTGSVSAYMDSNAAVELNGQSHSKTVRSTRCQLLSSASKCPVCVAYRDTIRSTYHRWVKTCRKSPSTSVSASSHKNDRWLKTPEMRKKVTELKKRMRSAESTVKYMKKKIAGSTDKIGVGVDDSLHTGLHAVMSEFSSHVEEKYAEDSFHRLFWEQQMKLISTEPKQRRWHPMLIHGVYT